MTSDSSTAALNKEGRLRSARALKITSVLLRLEQYEETSAGQAVLEQLLVQRGPELAQLHTCHIELLICVPSRGLEGSQRNTLIFFFSFPPLILRIEPRA